ncbi:MAG TPA: transketolase C-terminal domain-containing protein [Candidatus Dormibacteraeota bacterium]|nr:transketolase C-terminal domain-containing protein [Candidatus Dormibacteraeota bacterium]
MIRKIGSGNEAVVDAALAVGCKLFAAYPVTPASEILEHASQQFALHGRICIPTEGEITAIHLVAGASLGGFRSMTATTGLGFSLMTEALSFFSGMSELAGVVVLQQRWGPGDGSLGPGQDCYWQATKGGGHGDFRMIVLAPSSAQETVEHTMLAFELAERYRLFVVVLGDQLVALTSEIYEVPDPTPPIERETEFGRNGTLVMPELVAIDEKAGDFEALETLARRWEAKYAEIARSETRCDYLGPEDAGVLLVAYGSLARIAADALTDLEAQGIVAAVFRPVTLWPFPEQELSAWSAGRQVVVLELSMGQMLDDVRLAIGRRPDAFVNWLGGNAPTPGQMARRVTQALEEVRHASRI